MKVPSLFVIVGFVLLQLVSTPQDVASQINEPTVVIAYSDVESFPNALGYGVSIPDPPGICVELVRKIASELGISVKLIRLPNKRVLDNLKNGDVDAAFLYSYSAERASFAVYPMLSEAYPDPARRLTSQEYVIYSRVGSGLMWDGKTLTGVKNPIGANLGYSVVDDLRKAGIQVETARDTTQNLQKLALGRIHGFVTENTLMVDALIMDGRYGQLVKHHPPYIRKDYYLVFSKHFSATRPKLRDSLWNRVMLVRDDYINEVRSHYMKLVAEESD